MRINKNTNTYWVHQHTTYTIASQRSNISKDTYTYKKKLYVFYCEFSTHLSTWWRDL